MTFQNPIDIVITRYRGFTGGTVHPFVRFTANDSNFDLPNDIGYTAVAGAMSGVSFFKLASGAKNYKRFVINAAAAFEEESISVVELTWTAPSVPATTAEAPLGSGTEFWFRPLFDYGTYVQ